MTSHQSCPVITLMTAVIGLLTSVTAIWITLADRRRVIAKERREEAAADRRAAAAEAAELAQSVSRTRSEEMAQARAVQLRLLELSADEPGSTPDAWLVTVANRGPLPVMDVQVVRTVGPAMPYCSEPFDLQGESTHEVELPSTGERPRLAEVTAVFTDPAGRRWQRQLTGGLCLGVLQDDGTYQWDQPRFPETVIVGRGIQLGPVGLPERMHVVPLLVVPLLALTAVGCLLYILLR
ncbi:hypothetical protein [Streptomyces sp. NPDC002082]|uniref:hypothetical protein n=1 Tax=Streptomyces sp. NPDC002082 TaxID=3154772 RepID=UPI00332B8BCA